MKISFIFIITILTLAGLSLFIGGKALAQSTSPEWLLMKGVGYYNFLPDDPNKVQLELNEAFTARDQIVSPQNFKGAASKIDAKAVEFINKLMKNDDIAGYVLAHRRLVIIKYRSADWTSLIKFIESTYKGLK